MAAKDRFELAVREKERHVRLESIRKSMRRKIFAMEESNALMAFRRNLGNETAEDAVFREHSPKSQAHC